MTVVAYARVSTDRQAEKQTIAQQIERLQVYAHQHQWQLSAEQIYKDDGYSGARLDRPALDRLRDEAEAFDSRFRYSGMKTAARRASAFSSPSALDQAMDRTRLRESPASSSAPRSPRILEGRCVSFGSLVPYLPVADLFRQLFDLAETDSPDIVRQAARCQLWWQIERLEDVRYLERACGAGRATGRENALLIQIEQD